MGKMVLLYTSFPRIHILNHLILPFLEEEGLCLKKLQGLKTNLAIKRTFSIQYNSTKRCVDGVRLRHSLTAIGSLVKPLFRLSDSEVG